MERLEQKQLQKLRQQKMERELLYMEAAKQILKSDYVLTVYQYCRKILSQPLTQSLSEYSPTNLSKFIFDEQLEKARAMFDQLPNNQCKIEHFLLIMISVMKFPFQKWPYYLIGFKDMFNEIVSERKDTITYSSFFKYVIGEVLDFKEEVQNTEFQVRFEELKKQDYLMHDNGIKKFYYSTDMKMFMTLDESSPAIKLYNKQMRIIKKFTPNKEKHNKKFPNILWFDYSEMSERLGLVLSDCTFSVVNFHNFMNKSAADFEAGTLNEIVISFQEKLTKVIYIQMLNRWALITDDNKLKVFDMEKYRQVDSDKSRQTEEDKNRQGDLDKNRHVEPAANIKKNGQSDLEFLIEVRLENSDLQLKQILELVNLSMICVVAGNEISFFNESLTEKKHCKFTHCMEISHLRYCEETGLFYLCGEEEKFITIFGMIRNSENFKISTFQIQSKFCVAAFDVFPLLGTIVIVDRNHDARLYDLAQGTCYQMMSYSNIVKNQRNIIKMLKISKTQFALYETYTLVFQQQKIAIEKDTEYEFLPKTYYDEIKEEFYMSVNSQIISFSIPQGEIRKSYNMDTANVPKHEAFMLSKNTNLFVIDSEKFIYEAYLKEALPEGENKSYKKKIGITKFVNSFFDEEIKSVFVVGSSSIHTVRNDGMNNFTINSALNLEILPAIINANYSQHQKQLLLIHENQQFVVFDMETYQLLDRYIYHFPFDPKDHEDVIILQFDSNDHFELNILLTNRNQVYFLSKKDEAKMFCLRVEDYLPYKLKNLQFVSMHFSFISSNKVYLLLCDRTGHFFEINLSKFMRSNFSETEKQRKRYRFPVKDVHNLETINRALRDVYIGGVKAIEIDKENFYFFKAHEKEIQVMRKINVEGLRTLTIAIDGSVKLWNSTSCLFFLKLPDFKKVVWNMQEIQNIKNERSIDQIMKILDSLSQSADKKFSPLQLLKKNDELKSNEFGKEVKKFNLDEPIQMDIENKDIEQIVQKTHNINWYSLKSDSKSKERELSNAQRTNPHPWRTKNSFLKIMDKASPENKYKKKMPMDLMNLRTSLDMKDRREKLRNSKKYELFILPELNNYEAEKHPSRKKMEPKQQSLQNEEVVESCLYVKKSKNKKKINELDEIDKEFKKKWLVLTAKKFVPKNEHHKKSFSEQKSKNKVEYFNTPINEGKYDPIHEVKNIFENHNREAAITKRGRFIKIPQINLKREQIFSND